jgi:hypothetical protein
MSHYMYSSVTCLFLISKNSSEGIKIFFGSFRKISRKRKADRFDDRQKGGS